MIKLRKIVATFFGSFLIGSSASAMKIIRNPVESRIEAIMKALNDKKIQGEKSKMIFEYLELNHKLSSIEIEKNEAHEGELNAGNWDSWDTWNTWNTWDTWNTWNTWDTWNTWSTWDTWSTWSTWSNY
jgi:hypothetical protein